MEQKHLNRYIPLREQAVSLRRYITSTALRVFAGWGYREVEIPLIDDFEPLKKSFSTEQIEASVRFLDRSSNLKVLRSDSTAAIAKSLSHLKSLKLPQRVCYANKVVRFAKRRSDCQLENYQIGAELIGINGIAAEVELICMCHEVLTALQLTHFQFNLSDHSLVSRLLEMTGASMRIQDDVREAIRARDVFSVRHILYNGGIREKYIVAVSSLAEMKGGTEPLDKIDDLFGGDREVAASIRRLRGVVKTLDGLGFSDVIHVDLGAIHSSHYCDGIAFHIVADGAGRPIGCGGRYNQLFSIFGRDDMPVAGFYISADLICELIYPIAGVISSYVPPSDRVKISPDNMVEGFREVLERRKSGKTTRIIVTKPHNASIELENDDHV